MLDRPIPEPLMRLREFFGSVASSAERSLSSTKDALDDASSEELVWVDGSTSFFLRVNSAFMTLSHRSFSSAVSKYLGTGADIAKWEV